MSSSQLNNHRKPQHRLTRLSPDVRGYLWLKEHCPVILWATRVCGLRPSFYYQTGLETENSKLLAQKVLDDGDDVEAGPTSSKNSPAAKTRSTTCLEEALEDIQLDRPSLYYRVFDKIGVPFMMEWRCSISKDKYYWVTL